MDRKSLDACKRLLKTLMQSGEEYVRTVAHMLTRTFQMIYGKTLLHPLILHARENTQLIVVCEPGHAFVGEN